MTTEGRDQGQYTLELQLHPKVLLSSRGGMAAAGQPSGLWNSRKTFYKTFATSCSPRLYVVRTDGEGRGIHKKRN